MTDSSSSTPATPGDAAPIDPSTISNAILFCEDSIALLTKGRTRLNPLAENPGVFDMADSMIQLQKSMLNLLNWAHQVNAQLTGDSPK
jgi:hypothetical protein